MKRIIIALAVLVMAFGNTSFAQRKVDLKMNPTKNILNYFGFRDESTIVPLVANWETTEGGEYRTTYTYDEYDFYLIEEMTKVNEGPDWEYFYRITYEYDFAGNVIEKLGEIDMGAGWENDAQAFFTYDGENLSEVVYQEWENGNWVNDTKEVYNYNGSVITVLYWDWNGNNWASDELYTYTYDDLSVELVIQYMQGGAWQNDERQVRMFDMDGKTEEILDQDWAGTDWVNDDLTNYIYEGDVFITKTVKDWTGTAWEDDKKFTYTYDGNGNAVNGTSFVFGGYDYDLLQEDGDTEMTFGYGANSLEYYGYMVEIEYVDLTGMNENAQVGFVVYPVPAHGDVFVEAEDFQKAEIYSLTGQKLMESLRDRMNVSALSSGLYIMKVYDREGGCATQRFVVK